MDKSSLTPYLSFELLSAFLFRLEIKEINFVKNCTVNFVERKILYKIINLLMGILLISIELH